MKLHKIMALLLALLMVVPFAQAQEAAQAPETPETAQTETAEEPAEEPTEEEVPNYFAMVKTVDLNNEPFDGSVFEGKRLMINIWADWCPPCRAEMPALNKLAEEYKDKITIVGMIPEGVTVEEGKLVVVPEKLDLAKAVYEEMDITYPTIVPEEILYTLISQTGLQVFPTTWFVDERGYLIHIAESSYDEAGWRALMDNVLDFMDTQAEARENPDAAQ